MKKIKILRYFNLFLKIQCLSMPINDEILHLSNNKCEHKKKFLSNKAFRKNFLMCSAHK